MHLMRCRQPIGRNSEVTSGAGAVFQDGFACIRGSRARIQPGIDAGRNAPVAREKGVGDAGQEKRRRFHRCESRGWCMHAREGGFAARRSQTPALKGGGVTPGGVIAML
jgi:hypothetical protein